MRVNVQHDRQSGPVQHGFHFQFAQARRIVIDDQLIHRVVRLYSHHAVDAVHPRNLLHHRLIQGPHQVVAQLNFRHRDTQDIIRVVHGYQQKKLPSHMPCSSARA